MDQIDKLSHNTLLQSVALPSVTNDQKVFCDNDLTDKELFDALKGIRNNKLIPGRIPDQTHPDGHFPDQTHPQRTFPDQANAQQIFA